METALDLRMEVRDEERLAQAVKLLEHHGLAMTIAGKVGAPVEKLLQRLPAMAQKAVHNAVHRALEQCLKAALTGMDRQMITIPSNRMHRVFAGAAGAAGGFFGLPGLLVELPVSTTVMLHSIAEIARSHGEDLNDPANALACLEVFALGSGTSVGAEASNSLESAYYATRTALAQATREAATYLAQKGMAKGSAPVLVRFVSGIASRFGVDVAEKITAQMVPLIGAAGGLTLNVAFTSHFQRVAEGHFLVRELERRYGQSLVLQEYRRLQLLAKSGDGKSAS